MTDNFEAEKARFAGKIADILNFGAVNLAVGIGYRLELFDVMAEIGEPATVDAIAAVSGLNARYVREWLGVMCTAGIVELHSPEEADTAAKYLLPQARAAFLTRTSGTDNLGVYAQEIPLLTQSAMKAVMNGFRTGDGVPYSRYPEFQAFMAELGNAKHRRILVEEFLPSVAGGEIARKLETGIAVCDMGCGEGVPVNLMAAAFPASRFVGIDLDAEALERGRAEARSLKLSNAEFIQADAARLKDDPEWAERFDYITAFDAVHDQTRPLEALQSVRHMLRSGGVFSMIDIDCRSDHAGNLDHPMGPFLYTVSLMHCMPVGLNDGGAGLGMMWGREKALALLNKAGFTSIEMVEMPFDRFNLHYLCRK